MPIEVILSATTTDPAACRALAEDMCRAGEAEPGTLSLDWHLAPDGALRIVDCYADTGALLAHMDNVQANGTFDRFMQLITIERVDVIGSPDEQGRALLEQFGAHFLDELASMASA